MNWVTLVAGSSIAICTILVLVIAVVNRKKPPSFRQIPALEKMHQVLDQSVEEGTRLHVSLGKGNLASLRGASGLAGLSTLNRLSSLVSKSDLPPVSSSGDPGISILSQDVLKSVFHESSGDSEIFSNQARLTGLTPFSFAAGTIPIIQDGKVSTNVLIGNFGVEAGLILESDSRDNRKTIAATDDLPGQSVMYASTEQPLIGEELFAVSEYVQHNPIHAASLTVQDILRWTIILAILIGSIMKMGGVL